ncbi:zinc-finger-containing protein [Vibrio splendidus]|nr:hypothetical protein A147_00555 [Vibrio splendidus FF-6]
MRLRLICPYCQSFAYLKDSTPIYGESRGLKYICSNFASGCDAYVGIHKGDHIPLGRPADKKLRKKRRKCHQEFDFLMKQNPSLSKTEAYELVAQLMGIPVDDCHIALFDEELAEQFLTCIYKHLAVKD